ncbi:MAG: hypothetical protein R3E68_19145 [Burkholderiaceae bacterium]
MGVSRHTRIGLVVVPVARVTAFGHRTIGMAHPAIGQVGVIMMVLVHGQCLRRSLAEQTPVLVAPGDRDRVPLQHT